MTLREPFATMRESAADQIEDRETGAHAGERMTDHTEYRVTALRDGTVIDHLPPGLALKALEFLGHEGGNIVTVGMYLDSRKHGKKDLIKLERKELTEGTQERMIMVMIRLLIRPTSTNLKLILCMLLHVDFRF